MTSSAPFTFAIDAQISPTVPGGTETALLSLLHALRTHGGDERYVVLGLKGHVDPMRPFVGRDMQLIEYPKHYRWFVPGAADRRTFGPLWQKAARLAGPLSGAVRYLHGRYAHGQPLTPRARAVRNAVGPLGPAAVIGYRLYHGLRYGPHEVLTAAQSDAFLRPYGVRGVHFPYPLHFDTALPFVYEPWGLPHRHMPEMFREGEPEWIDALMRQGCERASMVVTATRWVKDDLVRAFGLPSAKVAVIPRLPAPPPETLPDDPADALGDVPERYALFPAMTWPTKNHLGLIRAIAQLRDRHGHRLHLLCTGRTDTPHYELIKAEIAQLGLGDQVRFLGRVSAGRLERLFRRAWFLVHPSKFEGLGLPPVEAFQRGVPVLASTAACIPEVVGDAALAFDPDDVEAITAALKRAVEEPELLAELKRRGSARVDAFFPPPAKLARMFATVYRKAAGAPLDPEGEALLTEMTA